MPKVQIALADVRIALPKVQIALPDVRVALADVRIALPDVRIALPDVRVVSSTGVHHRRDDPHIGQSHLQLGSAVDAEGWGC